MTDLLTEPDATTRRAGAEPLAGYRLIAPLGRGGFGEVWKCEAPGGLFKAIKFVPGGDAAFRQEREAFERIKGIRHPFLLTLERVEVVDSDLVMVMELADGQLHDRMCECHAARAGGIPRKELLGYMLETAEALDMIGSKYGLQHLDVKPANIFLVAGHAKVGDYGLVRRAGRGGDQAGGGFTPKYSAPEVLQGRIDMHSDQYSLALVYAEMLSGQFPLEGRTAAQLMLQHMRGVPELSPLPPCDRAAVGRALAKDPAERYDSCLRFVSDLISAVPGGSSVNPPVTPKPRSDTFDRTLPNGPAQTVPPLVRPSRPPAPPATLPQLQTHKSSAVLLTHDQTRAPAPPPQAASADPFADLTLVMPADRLHAPPPRALGPDEMAVGELVAVVVTAAVGRAAPPPVKPGGPLVAGKPFGEPVKLLCTLPANMLPHKVAVVAEKWKLISSTPETGKILLHRVYTAPPLRPGGPEFARTGYEVLIELPRPQAVEVRASARLHSAPDAAAGRAAKAELEAVLDALRTQLQTVQERRQHPRHRANLAVRAFPLFTDGKVGTGRDGKLVDVSLGGAQFVLPAEPGSDRLFVQFPGVPGVNHLTVYVRVLRTQPTPAGVSVVGRFRDDR